MLILFYKRDLVTNTTQYRKISTLINYHYKRIQCKCITPKNTTGYNTDCIHNTHKRLA